MHTIRDVNDYVRRLLVAGLLCPVAVGAWFLIFQGGFSFDGSFRFQVYAVWGVLAFGFLFLTFAMSPPHFNYRLKKVEQHWTTDVVED